MVGRVLRSAKVFPRQYWMLVSGSFLAATGASMVWPFLMLYLTRRLDVPLATISGLMTLNSAMGILCSFIAGTIADRMGRKNVMVASLLAGVGYFLLMSRDGSLLYYAALVGLWGGFNILYPVGANAMIADLIPGEQRMKAYAIVRICQNAGVAMGPVSGGFLISISYNFAFFTAASSFLLYGLFTIFFVRETLRNQDAGHAPHLNALESSGYRQVFKDRVFMGFVACMSGAFIAGSMIFIMLPVYANQQFGLTEADSSWIITVNAILCVTAQLLITRIIRRFPLLPTLGVGASFYAIGVGSIAFGTGFWSLILSVIIMTTGELIVTPTSTAVTANLAPPHLRGRYMSMYVLIWPISSGIGPPLAGLLYDNIAPQAMWIGGFTTALLGAIGFFLLSRRRPHFFA